MSIVTVLVTVRRWSFLRCGRRSLLSALERGLSFGGRRKKPRRPYWDLLGELGRRKKPQVNMIFKCSVFKGLFHHPGLLVLPLSEDLDPRHGRK